MPTNAALVVAPMGRRRKLWQSALVMAALALIATACSVSGERATAAAPVRLVVADSKSTTHYVVEGALVPWMACIERGTRGAVQFDFFPAGQLGALADYPAQMRRGLVDVAYVPPALHEGEMPLSEVHTLPGLFVDTEIASRIFADVSRTSAIAEVDYHRNGMRPLWGAMTEPSEVYANRPLGSLTTMAGMTLRGSGGALREVVDRIGANTLTLPTDEVYQALETGTADGTIMATASVSSYSVDEVTEYATDGMNLGSFWTAYAISEQAWRRLPATARPVVDACNDRAVADGARVTAAATAEARARFESEGLEFVELGESDRARLGHIYSQATRRWVERTRAIGGAEVVDAIRAGIADRSVR